MLANWIRRVRPVIGQRIPFSRWRTISAVIGLFMLGLYAAKIPKLLSPILEAALLVFLIHAIEREFFWRELIEMVQGALHKVTERHNSLLGAITNCGINSVYARRDSNVASDVARSIETARKRVWLLGVALSECIRLETVLQTLKSRVRSDKDFDLRILVLDPLRSPAVFRMFLEGSPEVNRSILNFSRPGSGELDPLFNQTLYTKVITAFNLISANADMTLRDRIRFYAHDPLCWLVLTDKTAFYQPYTFGRPPDCPSSCMGPFFPVFRFEKVTSSVTFQTLENHFHKLWITSDMDWFHFWPRLVDRERIAHELFQQRGDWFATVARALDFSITDRRLHPRVSAKSRQSTSLRVSWKVVESRREYPATIIDSSRKGIALEFAPPPDTVGTIATTLDVGKRVSINATTVSSNTPCSKQEKALIDYFCGSEYEAKWLNRKEPHLRIGLERADDDLRN